MGFLTWLHRNRPYETRPKWEGTDEGKEFVAKYKADLERRRLLKEAWERTTPPEKKEQVKLFKIILPIFFLGYVAVLFWGFKANKELWGLLCECCLSLVSLIFFFIKPRFVKYPNSFMMPVIAFGGAAFMYIYMGLMFGFDPKTRNKSHVDYEKIEKNGIEREFDEGEELSKSDFDNLEYTMFLSDNGFETKQELEEDYENYRNKIL